MVSNAILLGALTETQKRTHRWGVKNQVTFDPSKEAFKVLHPIHGEGEPFKLLGTLLDCKLKMIPCVEKLLSKVRPKIRALVRIRNAFSVKVMLNQYKAHVWSQCEYHDGALILACDTQLARFDSMQRGYLQEFSLTDTEAFVEYNFAPPSIRRRIAMLGFLHKCVLRAGHPSLSVLFPGAPFTSYHSCEIESCVSEVSTQWRLFFKSLHGYVLMYNRLPQYIVDCTTVHDFQNKLTRHVKQRARNNDASWRDALRDERQIWKLRGS